MNKELLEKIKQATTTPSMSPESKQRVRQNVLFNLSKIQQEQLSVKKSFFSVTFFRYAITPLALILLLTGTTYAADDALPGDVLYPVKRAVEASRMMMSFSAESKLELEVKFAEERIDELDKIQAQTIVLKPDPKHEPKTDQGTRTIQVDFPSLRPKVESKAQTQATIEVTNSLNSLLEKKVKLEATGNTKASIILGDKINKLKERTKEKREQQEEKREQIKEQFKDRLEKSDKKTDPKNPQDTPPSIIPKKSGTSTISPIYNTTGSQTISGTITTPTALPGTLTPEVKSETKESTQDSVREKNKVLERVKRFIK